MDVPVRTSSRSVLRQSHCSPQIIVQFVNLEIDELFAIIEFFRLIMSGILRVKIPPLIEGIADVNLSLI